MIEIPPDMSKGDLARMLARRNNASDIVYLLGRVKERMVKAQSTTNLPDTDKQVMAEAIEETETLMERIRMWDEEVAE